MSKTVVRKNESLDDALRRFKRAVVLFLLNKYSKACKNLKLLRTI